MAMTERSGQQESGQRDPIETIAKRFHHIYEGMAPAHGWESQCPVPWEAVPIENQRLMLAVVDMLLVEGTIKPGVMFDA